MRRHSFVCALTATALLCLAPAASSAEKLKRVIVREVAYDLTVELRQVKEDQEDQDGGPQTNGKVYSAGTASSTVGFAPQQVRVRNGEKASLQISETMPLQWVQKIESQSATLSAAGISASNNSGGVTQAVTWMESGQSLTVTPRWPGGKQPVKVEIEAQSSAVEARTSTDLPATSRQRYSTTISAPLRQWVTIATTGNVVAPGGYSSAGSSGGRHLVQVRVVPDN